MFHFVNVCVLRFHDLNNGTIIHVLVNTLIQNHPKRNESHLIYETILKIEND